MKKEKSEIIQSIAKSLLHNDIDGAKDIINSEYPHQYFEIEKRSYSINQKMEQFLKDGFIDRYTGEKLVNPGMLKILSVYFPNEFPYQPHWKMSQTHIAYWELVPTIDHIYPIAKGGCDNKDNWVTTSMKNNSIKSNYSLDEIHWKLYPAGNIEEWDGLTGLFVELVNTDKKLLDDTYISNWYNASKNVKYESGKEIRDM